MQFDPNGYLQPDKEIETTIAEFETIFVTSFPQSATRRQLFDNYRQYVEELQRLFTGGFYQWVNGSYVTRKVNPNDIDVVTFVDYRLYTGKEQELRQSKGFEYKKKTGLDAYYVATYPQEHPKHGIMQLDQMDWLYAFSRTRPQPNGKQYSKGFLKINF